MNSTEIKAYKCENCGQAYLDKSYANNCCKPKLCEDCGCELPKNYGYVLCEECRIKREELRELERYNKATKYTFKSVPTESIEWLYSKLYPHNEGYFDGENEEYFTEYDIKYVYGTKRVSPKYDAWDIIESMLEESYEDASDMVDKEEVNKLQQAIDAFVNNHNGCLDWFEVDYDVVINL